MIDMYRLVFVCMSVLYLYNDKFIVKLDSANIFCNADLLSSLKKA